MSINRPFDTNTWFNTQKPTLGCNFAGNLVKMSNYLENYFNMLTNGALYCFNLGFCNGTSGDVSDGHKRR